MPTDHRSIRVLPIVFLFVFCTAACSGVNGETASGQTKKRYTIPPGKNNTIDYLLYLPENYNKSNKKWPLILFLHGAGERGNALELVAKHGPPKFAGEKGKSLPFIVVSPQCPQGKWWSDRQQLTRLLALLDDVEKNYRVDKKRIYLTGLSMGGYGTWHLAAAAPERFAAIAPICGGGNPHDAEKLASLPIWAFHGAHDQAVPLAQSKRMVDAVKKQGGKPKFTVYPEAGHDSWSASYNNPELYRWFLSQQK